MDLHITDTGNQKPVADAGGSYLWVKDIPMTFDGSGSYDPDGIIVSYEWDFGDTNSGTGVSPTHTYTAAGNYTATLTVTDDGGKTDTDTADVTILESDDEPPSKVEGLTVTDAKDGKLNLAWNAATDNIGVDHYKIYRDGEFLINRTTTSYQNTGLQG